MSSTATISPSTDDELVTLRKSPESLVKAFGGQLIRAEQLAAQTTGPLTGQLAEQRAHQQNQRGWPLQIPLLDQYLPWGGFPRWEMSLLVGRPGLGATHLVLRAMSSAQKNDHSWVAWIGQDQVLTPSTKGDVEIDPRRLLIVQAPKNQDSCIHLIDFLREMIQSGLFAIIHCPWPKSRTEGLRNHQLIKLKHLCRLYQVSLIWSLNEDIALDRKTRILRSSLLSHFSLVIELEENFLRIQKASQRPGPWVCQRSQLYAHLMLELRKASSSRLRPSPQPQQIKVP